MDDRSTISDSGEATPNETPAPAPLEDRDLVGERLDRYVVEARLGAGGMGVVYAAYDPALDRRIALKVLPVTSVHRRDHLEQRLRREAQALARLDHPNVVAVYDVGVAEHSVFVAMQLVNGKNAAQWLDEPRTVPKILEMLVAVGTGLVAAHAAGIVHRDVKPSNVLIDKTGRVCIGDFGLARSADEPEPAQEDRSLFGAELTRTGSIMGTPPYMAPEQHRGENTTPRSDQFSYCVTAWEALYGEHPFVERWDVERARAAMQRDAVRDPPRGRGVPSRIERALRRGLRHDPEARWPSLESVVRAIAPRSYAAWWWAGAGIAAAVIVTSLVAPANGPTCDTPSASWGPVEQTAVRNAFLATGRPYARDTFERVARAIDVRDARWSVVHHDACNARGQESADLVDRRMACLQRRALETHALVEQFAMTSEAGVVDKAVSAVDKLGSIADCGDTEMLLGHSRGPRGLVDRMRFEDLERRIDRVAVFESLGKYQQALALVRPLLAEARTLGSPEAASEALYEIARIQDGLASYKDAEATAYDAVAEAGRAGNELLETRAMLLSIFITNDEEGRAEVASALARTAAGNVARLGRPDLAATLAYYEGSMFYARGKFSEAEQQLEKALKIYETPPVDQLAAARALNTLSLVRNDAGDGERALANVKQALAIYQDALGPQHPDTTTTSRTSR